MTRHVGSFKKLLLFLVVSYLGVFLVVKFALFVPRCRARLRNKLLNAGWTRCGIRKQPLIQIIEHQKVQITWEMNCLFGAVRFDWTKKQETGFTKLDIIKLKYVRHGPYHHVYSAEAKVENDSTYRYAIIAGSQEKTWSYEFKHKGESTLPLQLSVISDNHQGEVVFHQIAANLATRRSDYVLHLGDMVQRGFSLKDWETNFFEPLGRAGISQTIPFLIAQGNHDLNRRRPGLYSPEKTYFATTLGHARFIVLDTNMRTKEQLHWLETELSSSACQQASFRIVAMHIPPYIEFWRRKSWLEGDNHWPDYAREKFVPLFQKYRVDLVLSGHQHNYQRGMLNGIYYVIAGGSGGALDYEKVEEYKFYRKTKIEHHYLTLTIDENLLELKTLSVGNRVLDTLAISKSVA